MQREDEDRRLRANVLEDEWPEDKSDSSSLSVPNESIDFDWVYSLHTFVATVDGQANVVKGDSLFLMDDSNSYWWLVRVLKTQEVGYIPAENIETPYERLARLNKHRNVDLAAASPEERTLDPIAYRLHQVHLASQQHHPSHPSHPSNIRKRNISFRGSSMYHYPPAVWNEEEQLGWEEEDYEGYDTGVDHPLNDEEEDWEDEGDEDWDEIRRQQRYKSRDARTLHHTLQQQASNSTLQQQTSDKSLRQQDYKPALPQQGSREVLSTSELRSNNSPGFTLSGGSGSYTASGNLASAPKVFNLLGGRGGTRKILPSAILAQQDEERKSARYGGHSHLDAARQWSPVVGYTPKGGVTLPEQPSEKEAQKPEKTGELKIRKKGNIFRGLFGGKKEKDRIGDKGAAGAENGKRREEHYEPFGLVTTNEEGGPGGRVKAIYSTEPLEQGSGVGSTELLGSFTSAERRVYQRYMDTALQPSYGLQGESSFLPSFSSSASSKAKSGTSNPGDVVDQPVTSGPASSLKDKSRRSAGAMVLEVPSIGISGSGSGSSRQHLVDRSDIEKLKASLESVAEGYVHGEPLPPLIDAIPQRTEGRGPRQRKLGIEEGNVALPVLAISISDPGDDAGVDKVYDSDNGAFEDQEEKPAPTLETLMQTRIPVDLTGQVVVSDYRRPAHGGLAVVYPGLWNERPVAVKLLKFQKDGGADAYWDLSNERRVRREIRVWAALKHPNITEFLGYSTDLADFPAMISRWCERGTVLEHLRRQALSINQRMKLAQDVSRGLEYLHQLKVVHGDVKPANILVDNEGLAKLCDFGLVRLVDWEGPAGMTTTSPYTGTERYKAPELFVTAENRRPVATFAGDTYSLGCIMLEFIERIYPFQRFTKTYELRDAIMDGYAPALRSETTHALTDLTEYFWNLLEACWDARPDRPSIMVIVDALDNFARAMPDSP